MESTQIYIEWKKRRSRTRILANILIFFSGLEGQCMEVTSLFYLHQSLGLSMLDAAFYFTISETFFSINNAFSGIMFGRYVDKTRNMRFVFLLNLAIIGIGNLMYSIPYSVWWVIFGRFLCGINESLQTTVCGEFRRCYNDKEMINDLGWYEILNAVGMNLGPGLPILFTYVDFRIGLWRIYVNNIIPVATAFSVFIIFIVSWTQVIDLSKELDKIKAAYVEESELNGNKANIKGVIGLKRLSIPHKLETHEDNEEIIQSPKASEPRNYELMKWKDLLRFDIILLSLSYAFMRCTVSLSVTDVTLVSTKTFQWDMQTLAWLHIILGSSSYILITLLVKFKVFQESKNIFYSYVLGICTALVILSILVLPKVIKAPTRPSQIAFGGVVLFLKCFVYFQAQSSGKFLIFKTVSFENANFVDGFRSFVGNMFRLCVRGTLFYFFLYPEYYAPPVFLSGGLMMIILLARRNRYFDIGLIPDGYEPL